MLSSCKYNSAEIPVKFIPTFNSLSPKSQVILVEFHTLFFPTNQKNKLDCTICPSSMLGFLRHTLKFIKTPKKYNNNKYYFRANPQCYGLIYHPYWKNFHSYFSNLSNILSPQDSLVQLLTIHVYMDVQQVPQIQYFQNPQIWGATHPIPKTAHESVPYKLISTPSFQLLRLTTRDSPILSFCTPSLIYVQCFTVKTHLESISKSCDQGSACTLSDVTVLDEKTRVLCEKMHQSHHFSLKDPQWFPMSL